MSPKPDETALLRAFAIFEDADAAGELDDTGDTTPIDHEEAA